MPTGAAARWPACPYGRCLLSAPTSPAYGLGSGTAGGAEVAQHAVMEARIVQFQGYRVLEVDPAAHGLGGLPVGQPEQELQDADRGQPGW